MVFREFIANYLITNVGLWALGGGRGIDFGAFHLRLPTGMQHTQVIIYEVSKADIQSPVKVVSARNFVGKF